jgi:choline dehydrogenase-like flavoprotein
MEIDLAAGEVPRATVRSAVCVVGAGVVGLMLVRRLTRLGVDVVVLEAGGHSIEEGGQGLFAGAQLKGQAHRGTSEGRFRVFGGTSLRWGGQLLGMSREAAAEWPVSFEELTKFSAEAERMLGVDALPFEGVEFFPAMGAGMPPMMAEMGGVEARVSKWMGFTRRNLAATIGRELVAAARARVVLHAQVTEVLLAESGTRVEAVMARDGVGRAVRFEAEQFVLAAGTVETSRLLLASRSVAKKGVGNNFDQVGLGFHDHVTLPAATLTGAARARVLRELRPWVVAGMVHSVKLEASEALRARLGLNRMLAHVVIEEPEGTGAAAVREMLTAVQRGEVLKALGKDAARMPGALVEALKLAWEAKVKERRFVSKSAVVKLQFNVAQDVATASRIMLGEACDANGVPQAVVDWRVSEGEVESLRGYAGYLKERFEAMGLTGVEWVPGMFARGEALAGLEDARHAMGGARMGADPRSSVVDAELRVHGVENLSIAGGAVFPTGGAQLPTLTMGALALRLAERVRQGLGDRD